MWGRVVRKRCLLRLLGCLGLAMVVNYVRLTLTIEQVAVSSTQTTLAGAPPALVAEHRFNSSVIIYATYRGGSTFASEFFNRHQGFAFIYEPLCANSKTGRAVAAVHPVLEAFLRCEFQSSVVPALRQIELRWFQEKVFCLLPNQTEGCRVRDNRNHITSEDAMKQCRRKPHKAIKVIRVAHLRELEPYMHQGVKVVHLVRDPRAIMFSRDIVNKEYGYGRPTNNGHLYCSRAVADLAFAREAHQQQNSIFSRRYYYVRYEDLAFHPLREMTALYRFLDIEPDDSLLSWVREQDDKNHIEQPNEIKNTGKKISVMFGTDRKNPAFTSLAWRLDIPMKKVLKVQQYCAHFMEMSGYLPLTSEDALRDMNTPSLGHYDKIR